jgi:hypothetical protein
MIAGEQFSVLSFLESGVKLTLMKCFFLILCSLLSWSAAARKMDRQILRCLGDEERRFHLKKELGPLYDLNQRLIAEMVQIPDVEITTHDLNIICKSQNFSESWKLLQQSIIKGKDLFVLPPSLTGTQRSITKSMIDDYVEATREILLNFISQIQASAPSASCLQEEIPMLDNFFREIKYLQEDVEMKVLFKGKDQKIFEKLKNYPRAFDRCRERLKKKPKSGSTDAARKP